MPPSESTLQRSRPIAPPPTVVLIISTPIAFNVRCSRSVFENSSLATKLHPPSCLNCTPHAAPPSQHLYPHSHNLHPHASSAPPMLHLHFPDQHLRTLLSQAAPPKQHLNPLGCRHPPWLLKKVSYSLQATITLPSSCAELSTFDHGLC